MPARKTAKSRRTGSAVGESLICNLQALVDGLEAGRKIEDFCTVRRVRPTGMDRAISAILEARNAETVDDSKWPRFVEVSGFFADWKAIGLDDEDLRNLQTALRNDARLGAAVSGTGGARKMRVAASGRGKRGGARVWYADFPKLECLLLLAVYAKNERDDLTAGERRALAAALAVFRQGRGER